MVVVSLLGSVQPSLSMTTSMATTPSVPARRKASSSAQMSERRPLVGSVVVVFLSGSVQPTLAMAASIWGRPSVACRSKASSSTQMSDWKLEVGRVVLVVGRVVLVVVVSLPGRGQAAAVMARSTKASWNPVETWRSASNRSQNALNVGGLVVVVVVAVGGVDDVVVEDVDVVVVEVDVVDDVEVVEVVDDDVAVVDELDVLVVTVVDDDEELVVGPSGPQLGFVSCAGTSLVSLVTPLPSGFMVNRSGPLGAPKSWLLEENTILVPSGDHAGSVPPLTSLV